MIKSFIVMLILIGTGSSILERSHFKTRTLLKPAYSIGSMSKWGTSKGSRGGMPKSGIPGCGKSWSRTMEPNHLLASGSWAVRGWLQCTHQLQDPWGQPHAQVQKGKARPTQSCECFRLILVCNKKAHLIFTLLLGSVWGLKVWKIGIEKITMPCFFTCALSTTSHITEIMYPFFVGSRNISWQ